MANRIRSMLRTTLCSSRPLLSEILQYQAVRLCTAADLDCISRREARMNAQTYCPVRKFAHSYEACIVFLPRCVQVQSTKRCFFGKAVSYLTQPGCVGPKRQRCGRVKPRGLVPEDVARLVFTARQFQSGRHDGECMQGILSVVTAYLRQDLHI